MDSGCLDALTRNVRSPIPLVVRVRRTLTSEKTLHPGSHPFGPFRVRFTLSTDDGPESPSQGWRVRSRQKGGGPMNGFQERKGERERGPLFGGPFHSCLLEGPGRSSLRGIFHFHLPYPP